MADSLLIRHLCGPVWPGACGLTSNGDPWMLSQTTMSALVEHKHAGSPLQVDIVSLDPNWSIDLTDPLGLGLAGVAATVARRLGTLIDGPEALCLWLWEGGEDWIPRKLVDETIIATSTYLTLTDALCEAVGLEREGSEVARWILDAHQDDQSWYLWELRTSTGGLQFELDQAEWMPALESALAGQP